MGVPKIDITFRELAESIMQRSSRGTVALLLDDSTAQDALATYGRASDVDASKWTADNAAFIKLALSSGAAKALALRVTKNESTVSWDDEIDKLVPMKWNWLAAPSADASGMAAIATKIKELRAAGKTYKAVVAGATSGPDSEGVVNFAQTGSITTDCTGATDTLTPAEYTVRLAGLFAGLALDRSATGYELTDISSLAVDADPDTAVEAGKLIIVYNGEHYEICRAVTSLTTTTSTPKLFKKIKHVEGADMMADDLEAIWRASYRGKKVNSYDNKQSLVAEYLAYFKGLEGTVLSPDYANTAYINVEAQAAWLVTNGVDTSEMTDEEIARAETDEEVFIRCDIKLIDAMEDITTDVVLK